MKSRQDIYVTYGTDAGAMAKAVLSAAEVAAAVPDRDALIGLKPNLVLASPAGLGATTHLEMAAGAIEYFLEMGFRNIVILEGSWVGARTAEAFRACGYRELESRYGTPLWDTQKSPTRERDCAGMRLNICECVEKVEFLVNMPVLKGHCQTAVTCALKNLKGLIPDGEKRRFHSMGLMKPIAHLAAGIRQDFVLVDAVCGDLDFEEGGNPVRRDQVLGFFDPVLCDAYACRALGYRLSDAPYIQLAEQLGVGCADLEAARTHLLGEPGAARANLRADGRVKRLGAHVDARDACSACYANLIYALLRLEEEGGLGGLREKIAIGQGYRGLSGSLGIGRCAGGFLQCIPGCPPDAEAIAAFLREKLRR